MRIRVYSNRKNWEPEAAQMAIQLKNPERAPVGVGKAMAAAEFRAWLAFMGISASEAASLLAVTANTITSYRQAGADERVRLACRALARAAGKVRMIDIYEWEGQ
jgi:hypothetical protein